MRRKSKRDAEEKGGHRLYGEEFDEWFVRVLPILEKNAEEYEDRCKTVQREWFFPELSLPNTLSFFEPTDPEHPDTRTLEALEARGENHTALELARHVATDEERQVLTLIFVERLNCVETGRRLGFTRQKVTKLIKNLTKKTADLHKKT